MIAKVAGKRKDGRSSFHTLTRYIVGHDRDEKCTYLNVRNLDLVDFPGMARPEDFVDIAASEMRSTAAQNARVGDPAFHTVLSWPEGEKPAPEQIEEAIDIITENLGLQDCQCVYGLHSNTDHHHLHIAYNRVHPETYKAIKPANGWTKKTMEKSAREIEVAQGWALELSGKHFTVDNGEVVPVRGRREKEISLTPKARDFESHTGEVSAQSKGIERVTPELIKSAENWKDFHEKLAAQNIVYERKGSGAVFVIEGQPVKASSISKGCSLAKLEKRFGPFQEIPFEIAAERALAQPAESAELQASKTTEEKAEQRQPIKKYNMAKANFMREKKNAFATLQSEHAQEKKDLYDEQRERRKEALAGSWRGRGAERNYLRSLMAVEQARQRKALAEAQAAERKELNVQYERFPSIRQWEQGAQTPGNYVAPYAGEQPAQEKPAGIFGFEAVRVAGGAGYRRPGSHRPVVVDTGSKIRTRAVNEEAVLATLQLANAKWGGCKVHGNKAYVDLCVRLAVENGIRVTNPELQDQIQQQRNLLTGGRTDGPKDAGRDRGVLWNQREHEGPGGNGISERRAGGIGERSAAHQGKPGGDQMSVPGRIREQRKNLVEELGALIKDKPLTFHQEWVSLENPVNAATNKPYKGINNIGLSLKTMNNPELAGDPRWCTFNQAKEKGWKVKAGSHAMGRVEFWQWEQMVTKKDEQGNEVKVTERMDTPRVAMYPVFHASQIEGIPEYTVKNQWDRLEKAERILGESGAVIEHGGDRAFYRPRTDTIQLPTKEQFSDAAKYYGTALHELGHWTGHESRLNRSMVGRFGDDDYAREELRAELCSMFVERETGVSVSDDHFQNHAAYVQSWIKNLETDPNELYRAARDAENAAEFILQHERKREKAQDQTQEQENEAPRERPAKGMSAENQRIVDEVKALNLVEGEPKVYPRALKDATYKGEILHVDQEQGFAVQKIGKISLVVHRREELGGMLPEVGRHLQIVKKKNEQTKIREVDNGKEKKLTIAR